MRDTLEALRILLRPILICLGCLLILVGLFRDYVFAAVYVWASKDFGLIEVSVVVVGVISIAIGIFFNAAKYCFCEAKNRLTPIVVSMEYERPSRICWLLTFIALAFYADKLLLGPDAYIRIHDTFDVDFPRHLAQGKLLFEHGFSKWYPNLAGGIPAYAYHYPPYHLLSLLGALLPAWSIYATLVIAYMSLAGLGMYLLLVRLGNIPHPLSMLGGLIFMLSTQIQSNAIVHNMFLYVFPFFVVATSGKLFSNSGRWSFLVATFIALVILHVAYVDLTLIFFSVGHVAILWLFSSRCKKSNIKIFWATVAIWTGYVFIELPVVHGLLEFRSYVQRDYSLLTSVFGIDSLWNRIQGYPIKAFAYSGGLPLSFAAFVLARHSERLRRVLAIMIVLFSLTVFSAELAENFAVLQHLHLSHYIWVCPIFVSISLVFVVLELGNQAVPKYWRFVALWGSIVLLAVCFVFPTVSFFEKKTIALLNVVVTSIGLGAVFLSSDVYRKNKRLLENPKILVVLVLTAFLLIPIRMERLSAENQSYYLFSDSFELPIDVNSLEGVYRVGVIGLQPSVLHTKGLEAVDGRSPVLFRSYKELFKLVIKDQFNDKREEERFDAYYYDLYLKNPASKLNTSILAMMNTRYIVTTQPIENTENITLIEKVPLESLYQSLFVYEIRGVFERGFFVTDLVRVPDNQTVLDILSSETRSRLRQHAYIVDPSAASPTAELRGIGDGNIYPAESVEIMAYHPDRISFRLAVQEPGFLIVTNNYHPNWEAYVNGKKEPIIRANHAFQAIAIREIGDNEVNLSYNQPSLWSLHLVGFIFGGICLVFGIGLNFRMLKRA